MEVWRQVVYMRNADYVPRNEAPSGSAAAEVYLDKVVWRYMPDPWAAAEALVAGEVDWWQEPPDFFPRSSRIPTCRRSSISGAQGWLRPGHLHPPFNNKKAREALST
jgi:peptide/nickel transport system substrate-binding protein